MGDVHLLLDWHMGLLGCTTTEATPAAVPLSMDWKITCPQCRQCLNRTMAGPQKIKKTKLSQPPQGEAFSMTGLDPLVGGRKQPMNALELAYYAVLRNDGTVLRTMFEPFPLPLGKSRVFWIDFLTILWDGSWIFHEVKSGKRTEAGNIIAQYKGDGRTKWVWFCEQWSHIGRCKLAVGVRDKGRYIWDVRDESCQ